MGKGGGGGLCVPAWPLVHALVPTATVALCACSPKAPWLAASCSAFLNKKTWHPGGFKQARRAVPRGHRGALSRADAACVLYGEQQEDVWKREQAKAQEEKRLEELKKQIAEEREAQELLRVAQEAGHVSCVPRRALPPLARPL